MAGLITALFFSGDQAVGESLLTLFAAHPGKVSLQPIFGVQELDILLDREDIGCILCIPPEAEEDRGWSEILRRAQRHFPAVPLILVGAAGRAQWLAAQGRHYGVSDCITLDDARLLHETIVAASLHRQRMKACYAGVDDESCQIFSTLLDNHDGLCVTDAEARILLVNDAFTRITGYAQEEVRGQNPRILQSGEHDASFYQRMWETLAREQCWQGEIHNRHKDGGVFREWLRIAAVHDMAGRVTHYIGQFSYLAEQMRLVERINQIGRVDLLTGVPNRSLLLDRLDQALINAQRNACYVAIMVINIDRFHRINDALGQSTGDHVLHEVAQRMAQQIRQGDTVARLFGNEFGILLNGLTAEEDCQALALRLRACLVEPIANQTESLALTASIGIALYPRDGEDRESLLKSANAALAQARSEGGDCYCFHSREMESAAQRRQVIEAQLRRALERQEFSVAYQPQNSLDSGNIVGVEALLRWNNPELGVVGPAEFIPVAEESGLIIPIGAWVLEQSCAQNKEWLDLGLARLRVAVNLSARQFRNQSLVDDVAAILKKTGLPAEYLELEITESSLIHDMDSAINTCKRIKALGIKLSLDDFGTGYSSLTYVSRLPFDKLKIDQSFVRDITQNPANAAIATATIAIARGLNQSVLAEGVETEAQAMFLRARHCDAIQGFLFSHPVPADSVTQLLASKARLQLGGQACQTELALLVVDDEPSILNAMRRLFRHESFQVLVANNSEEAFEILAQRPIQVIVSDQRMPGMTGTEFFTRVRQLYPDTMRIILSGYTELETVIEAINRGAIYKFLTKPWDDEQLREQVREAFRLAGSGESR